MHPISCHSKIGIELSGSVFALILRERNWILGPALSCVFLAACYVQFAGKVFPVRGSIQFQSGYFRSESPTGAALTVDSGRQLANALVSKEVLAKAMRETNGLHLAILGAGDPVEALKGQLQVRADGSSDRLEIGLDSPFPHQAAAVVNAVIDSVLSTPGVNGGAEKGLAIDPLMVAKVNAATAEVQPKGLPTGLVMSVSAGLGLILGIGMAWLRGTSHQRVHSPDQIEAGIGLRTVGAMPFLSSQLSPAGRALAAFIDPTSEVALQCHSLLLHIIGGDFSRKAGSLLITSPARGDGRSTTALNLAAMLAMAGESVVVVDADFQSPSLHKLLELADSSPGLGDALEHPESTNHFVQPTHVKNLHLLSCGNSSSKANLTSAAMEAIIAKLREKYTYVLLDSGPMLDNPNTLALVSPCSATLLVLHAERTKLVRANECRRLLRHHGARQVAAIVNARHKEGLRQDLPPPVPAAPTEIYTDIHKYGWFRAKSSDAEFCVDSHQAQKHV